MGDYFHNGKRNRTEVAQLALELHKAGRHEDVIAAIRAALIHRQSQPWIFDALALAMKIADHPQKEIERVLLSRVDFTVEDVASMLFSAAYLTRFGAEREALQLCRQASRLALARPEPYVPLGLKLAERLKDYDGVQWAVAGILTCDWTKGHEQLRCLAEDSALVTYQTPSGTRCAISSSNCSRSFRPTTVTERFELSHLAAI